MPSYEELQQKVKQVEEDKAKLRQDLSNSRSEVDILKIEIDQVRHTPDVKQATPVHMSFSALRDKQDKVQHYTGLPSAAAFDALMTLCSRFDVHYYSGWVVKSISKEDQLFMTLLKLRWNFTVVDLGVRFDVSPTTVTNVTHTWISLLYEALYSGIIAKGIPSIAKNKSSLPACFSSFPSCRIVLDCTEIQIAIPHLMEHQSSTFSHYKQRNTFKALVGVAPNGVVTFVSKLYPGSTSDKEVVRHSRVLEQMNPGDMVLADKGFLIQDLMPPGVTLNLPPFLDTAQFTARQAQLTVSIARARIHVERAINRIKHFTILSFVPHDYRQCASQIFRVCAALTNLQNPLLKEIDTVSYYTEAPSSLTLARSAEIPQQPTMSLSAAADALSNLLPKIATEPPTSLPAAAVRVTPTESPSALERTSRPRIVLASAECCFICKVSDHRILRQCRMCGRHYHHMCQVEDEDGRMCNLCFSVFLEN